MELFLSIVLGLIGFISLILPLCICYKLIERDARLREDIENFKSLGSKKHHIEVTSPKIALLISKFAALVLALGGLGFTLALLNS